MYIIPKGNALWFNDKLIALNQITQTNVYHKKQNKNPIQNIRCYQGVTAKKAKGFFILHIIWTLPVKGSKNGARFSRSWAFVFHFQLV